MKDWSQENESDLLRGIQKIIFRTEKRTELQYIHELFIHCPLYVSHYSSPRTRRLQSLPSWLWHSFPHMCRLGTWSFAKHTLSSAVGSTKRCSPPLFLLCSAHGRKIWTRVFPSLYSPDSPAMSRTSGEIRIKDLRLLPTSRSGKILMIL